MVPFLDPRYITPPLDRFCEAVTCDGTVSIGIKLKVFKMRHFDCKYSFL